jgi:hypothetical protein
LPAKLSQAGNIHALHPLPFAAHWGAFTALVENARIVGCEPF